MNENEFLLFASNSNPGLTQKVVTYINRYYERNYSKTFELGKALVAKFSDGEVRIDINQNVRGSDVFVLQSTCHPVNDNLMELLIMCDALRRASARTITAVIPYYGYARQDKKTRPRVPITARLVADMIEKTGIKRIITVDLHANQIQGFFSVPVDNIYARPLIRELIEQEITKNMVLVSPDAGGTERARSLAKRLKVGFAIIDKRRDEPNKSKALGLIGKVKGKIAVLLDDMVDTAGTMIEGVEMLLHKGAVEVYACCVHAVLSGPAIRRICGSELKKLVVTDTIPLSKEAKKCGKIEVISIADLLGESIIRAFSNESVSELFD